jgi:multidrug resistance efflux pump
MKWLLVGLAIAALAFTPGCAIFGQPDPDTSALDAAATAQATLLERNVTAEARVVPVASATLRFLTDGIVAEVLVSEGQRVARGAPLARLDTRDLELAIDEARAEVARARAAYTRLADGARPEEIAGAEAVLAQARGQRDEALGAVTDADLAAAEAALAEARAALAQKEAGPASTAIEAARAELDQMRAAADGATTALQQTRDAASKAKTDGELALQQATIALQQAQAAYSTAYWNYRSVRDTGREPAEHEDDASPELSDQGTLAAYQAFRTAELELRAAERQQAQASINLEAARQDEITSIQAAEQQCAASEARVREAQARLEDVLNGVDADELARARADVTAAQAVLAQLEGLGRSGRLAAAEAVVAGAQARLDALQAPPRSADLADARARVAAAEAALRRADVARARATPTAPLSGTVVAVNVEVGERPDDTGAALVLADLERLEIETDDLTELDVVNIVEGAAATIGFEALPGVELRGRVSRVKPMGENNQGDITYTVTIAPERLDPRLRWNMTAQVVIAIQ